MKFHTYSYKYKTVRAEDKARERDKMGNRSNRGILLLQKSIKQICYSF